MSDIDNTLLGHRSRAAFIVGEDIMTGQDCSIFEGRSDVKFYARFIEGDVEHPERSCEFVKGRDNVEDGILAYSNALKVKQKYRKPYAKMSFCIDRDYDPFLHKRVYNEDFVHYQMWDKGADKFAGSNDLEGFIFSTKSINYVIKHFGVSDKKMGACKKSVIRAASYVGVLRIANKIVQGDSTEPVLSYERKEIGPSWFMALDFFSCGDCTIDFDGEKFLPFAKKYLLPKEESNPTYEGISRVFAEAERLLADGFEPGLRYCRGHDLMELLYALLCECGGDRAPESWNDFDAAVFLLPPFPSKERSDLLDRLAASPIYRDFNEGVFRRIRLGEIKQRLGLE